MEGSENEVSNLELDSKVSPTNSDDISIAKSEIIDSKPTPNNPSVVNSIDYYQHKKWLGWIILLSGLFLLFVTSGGLLSLMVCGLGLTLFIQGNHQITLAKSLFYAAIIVVIIALILFLIVLNALSAYSILALG
jgi:hypothetical protein